MSYYEYSKPILKLLNEKDPNSGLNLIFKANSELIKNSIIYKNLYSKQLSTN
jgi:hypothetical protein